MSIVTDSVRRYNAHGREICTLCETPLIRDEHILCPDCIRWQRILAGVAQTQGARL